MTDPLTQKVDLETPCLVLDLELLERNLQKMQAAADHAGKHLRPHVKTHKCSALARRQLEVGAIGVCVAKVSEAEALVRAGLDAILVTGPVATAGKVERLVDLLPAAPSLMTVIDHPAHMDLLDAALRRRDLSMGVLLDVDVGLNRTGVKPSNALALAARIRSCPSLQLLGIQAYAGQVQHIRSYQNRRETSHRCLQQAASLYRQLRSEMASCTIFSASGTGTFDIDLDIPEVTELQVGSYACMDAEYLAIGSAEDDRRFVAFEAALRLLTTVISANQDSFVTVDAGLKALYRDGGIPRVVTPGYLDTTYDWFGDEYGKVAAADTTALPPLGMVLELITAHCDPTINLFDRFFLTRGDRVVGTWPIDLRGCSQ